jgi:glutathione peroxidase
MTTVYDFSADSLSGQPVDLQQYKGKVLLIVNTASKCRFTPQYQGLEELHQQFAGQPFEVLGFPCNQFGQQEPGNAAEIGAFCEQNYGVSFPLFARIDVNGEQAHPLYQHLKKNAPGILGTQGIKWNFTKFLVRKDGSIHGRYAPTTKPEDLSEEIRQLIAQ